MRNILQWIGLILVLLSGVTFITLRISGLAMNMSESTLYNILYIGIAVGLLFTLVSYLFPNTKPNH